MAICIQTNQSFYSSLFDPVNLLYFQYSEEHLLNGLYWEEYYNENVVPIEKRGYIYFENKLLGKPRLRQVRVRNDSCV